MALHGAIHLMGFAKAFGFARLEGLKQPISRTLGCLWLLAALLFLATAGLLLTGRPWWWVGAGALLVSQALLLGAWSDARHGTWANLIILVPLALALADLRPGSLTSAYRREAAAGLARQTTPRMITEGDLAFLPPALQAYLRRVGVVGRPRVRSFSARFVGELKISHTGPWMSIKGEQVSLIQPPSRFFLLEASRFGLPFQAYHRLVGTTATMKVRVASLFEVVDASGPEMDQGEAVTFLNDLCVLAPGALLELPIRWEQPGPGLVLATWTRPAHTVSAALTFNAQGELTGFVSNDRFQSEDGRRFLRYPWSTPVGPARTFGALRLPGSGEAVWREPGGEFPYARFRFCDITMNPQGRVASSP